MSSAVLRNQIADYLWTGGDNGGYKLMGAGFNSLDEAPSAQVTTRTYISDAAGYTSVRSYKTKFSFDTDLIADEDAIKELYDIGRNQLTGDGAQRDFVRVELFSPVSGQTGVYAARKFTVAAEISKCSGAGGEAVQVTGALHSVGPFTDGTFNVNDKTFTAAE